MLNLTHETYFFALVNVGAFTFSLALFNTYSYSRSSFMLATSQKSNFLHLLILFVLGYGSRYVPQISGVLWVCMVPVIVLVFKMKSRVLIAFLMAFLLYTLFDQASKTAVLMNILAIFVALEKYSYNGLKNRKRNFKRFALLGFVVVLLSFTFANKNRGTLHADASMEYYSNQGINWSLPSEIFMPYMYSTSPWANLQYVLETQTAHTWGLWTLKPFLGYLFLDNLFEEFYQLTAYSSFNTFTYMVCAFKDFGYAGSFLMSVIIGYFVKYVYTNFKLSESPFNVSIYACTCLAVLEMFFSNHFFMQSYPFTIIIVLGLYRGVIYLIEDGARLQ